MAEQERRSSENPDRRRLQLPPLCLDSIKQMGSSAPTTPVSHSKPTSVRANCLCSPTTHAGSFRCRYHRNSSTCLTRNSMSIGSKLSELAGKTTKMCDALHAR